MNYHVRRRGPSWRGVVYLGRDKDGRQERVTLTRRTKGEAESECRRIIREVESGSYADPGKMTTGGLLERWLADSAATRVSPKTLHRYQDIVRNYITPDLGRIPLRSLTSAAIQRYYGKELRTGRADGRSGLAPATVRQHHAVLHKALSWAVRMGLLSQNPAASVEAPRPTHREMKVATVAEMRAVMESARGTQLFVPVMLAIATGMRRGEILGLHWKEVDLATARVVVKFSLSQVAGEVMLKEPKSKAGRRIVTLPAFAVEELRRYRKLQNERRLFMGADWQDHGLVCTRGDGSAIRPDTFSHEFAALVKRRGLPGIRFHDLRHSHATALLESENAKVVSERLGHSHISVTLGIYAHVSAALQERAAARLDEAFGAPSEGSEHHPSTISSIEATATERGEKKAPAN